MTDPVDSNDRPRARRESPDRPDPFGRNIPPNERVIRREGWQPEFTPLGEPAPEPAAQVDDQASAPRPFSPPQEPAWIQPARPGRRHHGHRHSRSIHCLPHSGGFPWLFAILLMVALGWIGHMWWVFFFIWPLGYLFKGMHRSRPTTLGIILIAAGVLFGLSTLGVSAALVLPLLLIAGGLMVLLRTLQAPSSV